MTTGTESTTIVESAVVAVSAFLMGCTQLVSNAVKTTARIKTCFIVLFFFENVVYVSKKNLEILNTRAGLTQLRVPSRLKPTTSGFVVTLALECLL